MRLYEYEGKALLARHGLEVPRGAVWPDLPEVEGPLAVKAQVLAGRRGKQGGIRFAAGRDEARQAAEALLGSRLGDHPVEQVYLEERLEIERELYLAVLVDRDLRAPLLLATRHGGMEVEEVPEDEWVSLPIDPLLGLSPSAARYVAGRLDLSGDLSRRAEETIHGMYAAFKAEEAELVEVNPLAVTRDGRLVALDAKVVLNDDSGFRHPDRPAARREGTPFERRCAELGAAGVEMEGTVAAVVSGAGLMMATVDLLRSAGVELRAAVDTAGTTLRETPEALSEVIRGVIALRPEVIYIGAFLQLAFCDRFARGIAAAFEGQDYRGKVILRLKGRNLAEARAVVESLGFTAVEDLAEATDLVVAAATKG